ncbi:MAG: hypothetical protein K8T20_04185 [Planctomycetes bacterium]|nr:hypothetical protein [Planctomycetota bacterium]
MNRLAVLPALAGALLVALLVAPIRAGADASTPAHLSWATSLADGLRNQTLAGFRTNASGSALNAFSTTEKVCLWNSEGAAFNENRTNCTYFVARQLKHAYGWSDTQFRTKTGYTWPAAENFYNCVVTGKGFTQVTCLADVQPGDIIASWYVDDPNSAYPVVTGHVMIINSITPPFSGTLAYSSLPARWRDVEIIDSSRTVHSLDTRTFQAGELGTGSAYTEWEGCGRGWMRFYVDASDNYLGYTWSMTGNKTSPPGTPAALSYYTGNFKPESVRHLAIGRVQVP